MNTLRLVREHVKTLFFIFHIFHFMSIHLMLIIEITVAGGVFFV